MFLCLAEEKLEKVLLRLLNLCNLEARRVVSSLKIKQQYTLLDAPFFTARPDFSLCGKALFGSTPSEKRGKEIESFLSHIEEDPLEKTSLAVENNLRFMERLKKKAPEHRLVCLFTEKPFSSLPRLEKVCHWSLTSDQGLSLFEAKGVFFPFLSAALAHAFIEHASLFSASTGSTSNGDCGEEKCRFEFLDQGVRIHSIGASACCAFPLTALHAMFADSLELFLDEIANAVGDRRDLSTKEVIDLALLCTRKHAAPPVPIQKNFRAFPSLLDKKTTRAFEKIMGQKELEALFASYVQQYVEKKEREMRLLIALFFSHILPTVCRVQGVDFSIARAAIEDLKRLDEEMADFGWEGKGKVFSEIIEPKMEEARTAIDLLEEKIDSALWPFPKSPQLLTFSR